MRVDIEILEDTHPILAVIAEYNNGSPIAQRVDIGIYEMGHFSFDMAVPDGTITDDYPDEIDGEFVGCYGVCDNYKQILEKYPVIDNSNCAYVIALSLVEKKNQESWGGWRWHKWGEYIGEHEITQEYLYDEPKVEKIYCYHIYKVNKETSQ